MNKSSLKWWGSICIVAATSYFSYCLGQWSVLPTVKRNLAIVSLIAVEPAVILSELNSQKMGVVSREMMVEVEHAIYLVAAQSLFFSSEISNLPGDAKSTLCVIARDRQRHKDFLMPAAMYSDFLMQHLEDVYRELISQAGNGHEFCSLPKDIASKVISPERSSKVPL